MSPPRSDRILKVLTPNDVGDTRSHQAGWTVPKTMVGFFPPLDPSKLNPDTWLLVIGPGGQHWSWRYIYYNSRLHHLGTRNEYRLTHVVDAIRDLGALAGDLVEFTRDHEEVHIRILSEIAVFKGTKPHVIDLTGPARWFVGQLPVR